SLAQAGYIAMAFAVMTPMALTGGIFYALAHAFMKGGAFIAAAAVVWMVGYAKTDRFDIPDHLDNFKGLGKRMPLAAAALTIFLVSLTGLPPTVGFIGKLLIFSALLGKGTIYVWLALIGVLTSVISLYYYFKIPLNMYLRESEDGTTSQFDFSLMSNALVAFLMIITIVLGLYFSPLSAFAKHSATILGAVTN
ncbi:MAG: NADH-quinone oxidoreductase subunit N, partial [Chlorobiales bacterium]|nr:NADH-quinone oxidoreductase subunit N [Chlorobiales bacterium]